MVGSARARLSVRVGLVTRLEGTIMEQTDRGPLIALVCGAIAALLSVAMFWMIVPSVGLGIAAIVLGLRSKSGDAGKGREFAAAAVALGIVAILGTGGSWITSAAGEDYGRDCALNPQDDC